MCLMEDSLIIAAKRGIRAEPVEFAATREMLPSEWDVAEPIDESNTVIPEANKASPIITSRIVIPDWD